MTVFRPFRFLAPIRRYVREGDQYNRAREWVNAARAYRSALRLDPSRAAIWVQLGHACKEHGDLDEAEAAYRQATRLTPQDVDPWWQLANLLVLKGDTKASIEAFVEAGRAAGDAELGAAEIRSQKQRLDEREKEFSRPKWVDDAIYADWCALGFSGQALGFFDPWAYWQINPSVRADIGDVDPAALVRHFCERGIEQGFSFSLRERFDPDFYRAHTLNDMPFSVGNAYRHWLRVGTLHHAPPNEARWLQGLLGDDILKIDGIDLVMFRALSDPDPAKCSARVMVDDLIAGLLGDRSDFITPSRVNARFLNAVAAKGERSADREERDGALRLRERIRVAVPDFAANTRALICCNIDREMNSAALSLLMELVDHGDADARIYLLLTECLERLGLFDVARVRIQEGVRRWPGDMALRQRAEKLETQQFHSVWRQAMAAARKGQVAEGRGLISTFLDTLPQIEPSPVERLPCIRSVAIITLKYPLQCYFYRVTQRREQLERAGYSVRIFDLQSELPTFLATAGTFDTAIFFRVPAYPDTVRAILLARALGMATFYDIDDPIFASEHYPEAFESYGGTITLDTYYGLALGAPLFAKAMALCAHGIASTEPLAALMRPFLPNGQVFVLPNGLGDAHLSAVRAFEQRPPKPNGAPITIFYGSNTKAHREDIEVLLEPALIEIAKRHGKRVRICIIGALAETSRLHTVRDNITLLPVLEDVQSYWSLLASADINLALLSPSVVTDTKSGIKWLEAAMFGIPSVLSDTAGYRAVARDQETALFAGSMQEWVSALDRLVRDVALRRRIGDAAREQAFALYGPAQMAQACQAIAKSVVPHVQRPATVTPLKTLVVNVFYPPQAIGGATRVVHDNMCDLRRLEGERFHLEVFSSLIDGTPHQALFHVQDGIAVTSVGALDVPDKDAIADDPEMVAQFEATLDRMRPDLVHFHCIQRLTIGIVEATRVRGIPYCITVHDAWWISDQQFVIDQLGHARLYDYADPFATIAHCGAAAHARMERLRPALFGASAVLAVSESFGALYRRCGVPNVRVIENGVTPLEPAPRKREAGGRVRLGFIGGLARHKGWDLVEIALQQGGFANLELLAIDHAMSAGDERHAHFGTTPVSFRGKAPQNDVTALYAEIDVLLAPSIWPESFGLVTREAALCGCWVVASQRGAIGDVIDDGVNGFHVDVSTADGLRDILGRIDNDPARFRVSPPPVSKLRTSVDQARDLAALYGEFLSTEAR